LKPPAYQILAFRLCERRYMSFSGTLREIMRK